MTDFTHTDYNKVKRIPKRGHYDKETIYAIVDEALVCHVAFVVDERPFIIPTLHARDGDTILLHGATTSRLIQHVQAGHEVCISTTLIDGLVLARSVFHNSVNYRSAVLFGRGHLVEDEAEKLHGMELLTEKILNGRWADSRLPNPKELKATSIVAIPIETASAKIRVGPPSDDAEDISLPIWSGVLPIQPQVGQPIDAPDLPAGIPVPDYVQTFVEQY